MTALFATKVSHKPRIPGAWFFGEFERFTPARSCFDSLGSR